MFFIKKFFILGIISFLLLATVQICLKNPKTRELLTDVEKAENIKFITEHTKNYLVFSSSDPQSTEIYFNGEKLGDFVSYSFDSNIICDGVFEIKNNSNRIITVTVHSFCETATVKIVNSQFEKGIKPLCIVTTD